MATKSSNEISNDNSNNSNCSDATPSQNESLLTPPTTVSVEQARKDQDQSATSREVDHSKEQHDSAKSEVPAVTAVQEESSKEPESVSALRLEDTEREEVLSQENNELSHQDVESHAVLPVPDQISDDLKDVELKVNLPQLDSQAASSAGSGVEERGDQEVATSVSGEDSDVKKAADSNCHSDETEPVAEATGEAGAVPDAANNENYVKDGESIHQIKWTYFNKKQVPIVTQNENGPCPLLALVNVLLLQDRMKLTPKAEIVSAGQLMAHLGDCVLQNVPGEEGVSALSRLNFEQNMGDAMAVMYKLQTGLDVNVRFTGVRDFEYTSECIIFDLLQIPLYHGWLVDPQNQAEVEAVGKCSYNQLVEKIIVQKTSDQPDLVSQALVAEEFLDTSASQLTYHGLCELCTQLKEEELAVLFRNNHFTTLYKHKGELFQLVTDQGFLHESNVVWETLSNVEGDCHFVDSEFHTYTKPDTPTIPVEASNVPVNSEDQINHDFLVALSLEQEQQQQQPVDQNWVPQSNTLSDEELAKQLQEEERQAAMAEANDAQRHQQQRQQQQQQPSSQRRPTDRSHQRRDEKKSDCTIL